MELRPWGVEMLSDRPSCGSPADLQASKMAVWVLRYLLAELSSLHRRWSYGRPLLTRQVAPGPGFAQASRRRR